MALVVFYQLHSQALILYFSASYDVDNDDEVETSATRLQSITPEEWADIKKLTKQESIRPSEIEGKQKLRVKFLFHKYFI